MQDKNSSEGKKSLLEWMKRNKISIKDLAEELDIRYHVVWHWIAGHRRPDLDNACLIEDLTNGYVTCRSWYKAKENLLKATTKPKKSGKDKRNKKNETKDKKCTEKITLK